MSVSPLNSPDSPSSDRTSPARSSVNRGTDRRDGKSGVPKELGDLLEALCEDRLTNEENVRLEQILLVDPAARAYYLNYIDLHGALYWDLAVAAPEADEAVSALVDAAIVRLANPTSDPEAVMHPDPLDSGLSGIDQPASGCARKFLSRKMLRRAGMGVAASLILGLGVWIGNQTANAKHLATVPNSTDKTDSAFVSGGDNETQPKLRQNQSTRKTSDRSIANDETNHGEVPKSPPESPVEPTKFGPDDVRLANDVKLDNSSTVAAASPVETPDAPSNSIAEASSNSTARQNGATGSTAASSDQIIAYINDQLKTTWAKSKILPSSKADDAEWLRRLHLDLLGHIPAASDVDKFLANRSPSKRANEVDRLLDSPAFARNFAAIWTNLLVGRVPREEVNRQALAAFLRQNFGRNRPWHEIVFDLVAAEGRTDQNGAANFLVAHLNGGAIPATGITSRLFLGAQLQCAQCHNHPFSESKQEQFWAFNSFFQQAVVVRVPRYDAKTGRMVVAGIELATKDVDGPVYYETRSGLMKVAYPAFGSTKVDTKQVTSRRRELARLMTQSEGSSLAPAFINRMWAHFHGRSFTPVVDDMGPHVAPSHPQLLDKLSEEFVHSGYDIKQLIRWICNSESYQLTSKFGENNSQDAPETGEPPLFSHMYVKPMSPEQLYDSLVVATQGQLAGGPTLDQSDKTRDNWLKQFVVSFETEENDETSTLNGSITQHLLMMNGELVRNATDVHAGTWLHKVLAAKSNETERIQALFAAALSRPATAKELVGVKKILKNGVSHAKNVSTQEAYLEAYQDIYWALLNSNEFVLNH